MNPVAPTHRPRGYAGIATIWKKAIDSSIEVLPDGSTRLQAIKISTKDYAITLINTYMPTEGSLDASCTYGSLLDEVFEVTMKYSSSSTIIWAGDLNGSFERKKCTSNDRLLQKFCKEVGYILPACSPNSPTYYHFTGNSSSRIDHFLQLKQQKPIIHTIKIDHRNPVNSSTHDSLMAVLSASPATKDTRTSTSNNAIKKRINWNKVDKVLYQSTTQLKLEVLCETLPLPSQVLIERIHSILETSAKEASSVTDRKIRRKPQKPNWPPSVIQRVAEVKAAHWNNKTNPSAEAELRLKACKKQLRSEQRQCNAARQREYMQSIMVAASSNDQKLFTLVKQQRQHSGSDAYIEFSPPTDDQLDGWKKYYQKLATPLDMPHFDSEYKAAIELKHLLIESIEARNTPQVEITQSQVRKYITALKNNKAADIFGICSKHFKHSGPMLQELISVFLQDVFTLRSIPFTLKQGVLTPVLIKLKPSLCPDSY